jgi:hypothetical protein
MTQLEYFWCQPCGPNSENKPKNVIPYHRALASANRNLRFHVDCCTLLFAVPVLYSINLSDAPICHVVSAAPQSITYKRKIAIAKMAAGYTRYTARCSLVLVSTAARVCLSVVLWTHCQPAAFILHMIQQVKADKTLGNALSLVNFEWNMRKANCKISAPHHLSEFENTFFIQLADFIKFCLDLDVLLTTSGHTQIAYCPFYLHLFLPQYTFY